MKLCFDYGSMGTQLLRLRCIVPAHLAIALQAGAIMAKEAWRVNQRSLLLADIVASRMSVLTDSYVGFRKAIRKESGAEMDEFASQFEEVMLFGDFVQLGDVQE